MADASTQFKGAPDTKTGVTAASATKNGMQYGDGVNPPADTTKPAIYIPSDGSEWKAWPANGSAWV